MSPVHAVAALLDEVRADHRFLVELRVRYDDREEFRPGAHPIGRLRGAARLLSDLVSNIGFQQLAFFRLASMLGRAGATPLAMVASRLLRHLYGAEMHWQAQIAPGIALVHGNGLVVSREARVESGCVLFQNVTLGISSDPTGATNGGAPHLHENVHVGPGAVVLGPVEIGPNSKVAGGTTVLQSVPPGMAVTASPNVVSPRRGAPTTPR